MDLHELFASGYVMFVAREIVVVTRAPRLAVCEQSGCAYCAGSLSLLIVSETSRNKSKRSYSNVILL
jgi:hypothetical protein